MVGIVVLRLATTLDQLINHPVTVPRFCGIDCLCYSTARYGLPKQRLLEDMFD